MQNLATNNQKTTSTFLVLTKHNLNQSEKQQILPVQPFKNRGYSAVTMNTKQFTQGENSRIAEYQDIEIDRRNNIQDLNRVDTQDFDQSMLSEALSTKKEDYIKIINQLKEQIKDIDETRIQQIDTLTKIIEGIQKDYQEFIMQLYKQRDEQILIERQKGWKQLEKQKLEHQIQIKKIQKQLSSKEDLLKSKSKNVYPSEVVQKSRKIYQETEQEKQQKIESNQNQQIQKIIQELQRYKTKQKQLEEILKNSEIDFQQKLIEMNKNNEKIIESINKNAQKSNNMLIEKYQEEIWNVKCQNQIVRQKKDEIEKEKLQLKLETQKQFKQLENKNLHLQEQIKDLHNQYQQKQANLKEKFQIKINSLQKLLKQKEQIIHQSRRKQDEILNLKKKKQFITQSCNTDNWMLDKYKQNQELNAMLDKFVAASHMQLRQLNQILSNYQNSEQNTNQIQNRHTPQIIKYQDRHQIKNTVEKENSNIKSNLKNVDKNELSIRIQVEDKNKSIDKSTNPCSEFSQIQNQIVKRRQLKINQLYDEVKALKVSLSSSFSPRNKQLPKSFIPSGKKKQLSLRSNINRVIISPNLQQIGKKITESHERIQMFYEIQHLKAINEKLTKKLQESGEKTLIASKHSEPYQHQNYYIGDIGKNSQNQLWENNTPQVEHYSGYHLRSEYSLSKPKKIAKSIIVEQVRQPDEQSPVNREKINSINTDISGYKLLTPIKVEKRIQDLRKIYRSKEFTVSQKSSHQMLLRKVHLLQRQNQLFQEQLNTLQRENMTLRNRVTTQMKIQKNQEHLKEQVRDLKNQMKRSAFKYKSDIYNNVKPFDTNSAYSQKSQQRSERASKHRNTLVDSYIIPSQENKNLKLSRSKNSKITAVQKSKLGYQSSGNLFQGQIDDFDKFMKRTRLNSVVSSILSKN